MRSQFCLTLRLPSEKIRASADKTMMRRAFPMQLVALRRRTMRGRAAARIAALLGALIVVEEARAEEIAGSDAWLAEADADAPRNEVADAVADAVATTEPPAGI